MFIRDKLNSLVFNKYDFVIEDEIVRPMNAPVGSISGSEKKCSLIASNVFLCI